MVPSRKITAEPYVWPSAAPLDRDTTALVIIDMQVDCKRIRGICPDSRSLPRPWNQVVTIMKKKYLPDKACSLCTWGYAAHQGIPMEPVASIIPRIQTLLATFRRTGYQVYHTREGHRPDLSTLSLRELNRSRNNPFGLGIGDPGPLGRLLVRGEPGHEIIPELAPSATEPVIDKPGRSAFLHTDFKLLLDVRGIKNLVICGVTTDVCVSSTMRDANDLGLECLMVSDACAAARKDLHESFLESVKMEGGIFGAVAGTADVLAILEN